MNLHKNKSSQKSLKSRKGSFVQHDDSFATEMMLKRQKIIEKKISLNKRLDCIGGKKQSLYSINKKSYVDNSPLYPSVISNKYPNPVLKRKSKKLNETSLMQNTIFYKNDKKKESMASSIQPGFLLAKNLSENYLLKNENHSRSKSRHKIIKDHSSHEHIKVKSQDKYIIHKDKLLERSKNLNKSLHNFQSKSQSKKVKIHWSYKIN